MGMRESKLLTEKFYQHDCHIGLICHRKKYAVELFLAKEAKLIKNITSLFHLLFPFFIPTEIPCCLFQMDAWLREDIQYRISSRS